MSGAMRSDVADDWQWADRYLPVIQQILLINAGGIVSFQVAPPNEDMEQATDIMLNTENGQIAVRVRRDNCYHRDLTIRSRRLSGVETELSKIKRGFARWYLYCWVGEKKQIDDWILVDLDCLRASGLLDAQRKEIPNTDNRTWFISINHKELNKKGCLLAYKLGDDSKIALPEAVLSRLETLQAEVDRLTERDNKVEDRKKEWAKAVRKELQSELNAHSQQIQQLTALLGQLLSTDEGQSAFLNVSDYKIKGVSQHQGGNNGHN